MFLEVSISREIFIACAFTAAFGLMFLISEIIYSKFKVDAELTRKFIHISCGIIAMLVPVVMPQLITIISLGIFFFFLTFYIYRKGLLPSINAVKRHSIGSILYPIGIVLCVVFGMKDNNGIYFFIPLGNMIFSDTVAAMTGINFPIRKFNVMGFKKSLGGSIGFFVTSFVICYTIESFILSSNVNPELIIQSLTFAMATTLVELISVDGWDDLTVPVSSFFVLLLMN